MFITKAKSFVLLLAFACAVVALLQPTSAGATSAGGPHLMSTRNHAGYGGGGGGGGGNLVYRGGAVMNGTAHSYAIFWEPKGSYISPTYHQLILRFFSDIGRSGLYHNNVQYPDGQGRFPQKAVLSGSWVDTAQYPSNPIYDLDIQKEVTHAQHVKHWVPASTNVFFVFTAKGENVCFVGGPCSFTNFCGYHFFYGTTFSFYASIPYEGTAPGACGTYYTANHDIDADSAINIASHELMESVTDPTTYSWTDSLGQEIGDKCAWVFGNVAPDGSNIHLNGHPYIIQQEWDNAISGCTFKGP